MIGRAPLFTAVLLLAACKSEPKDAPPPAATPMPSAPAAPAKAPEIKPESSGVTRIEQTTRSEEEYGYALGAAGDRIAISAFKRAAQTGEEKPGAVFVYLLADDKPKLEAELVVDKGHQIGNALAFDGDTLAVGAMYDAGAQPETGAAYVFERGAEGWSKPIKLPAKQLKKDDSFGIGVAMAGDSVVVSNSRETGGSLFVFEKAKTGYQQKQALPFTEPGGPGETIAARGDWVVSGAQFGGKPEEQGSVLAFVRKAGMFHAEAVLEDEKPVNEGHFGGAVAVGEKRLAVASESQITVFELSAGRWQRQARISPPSAVGLADAALALGDDVLVIGLPIVEDGRVLVYRKQGTAWVLERMLRAPDGKKDDWFGFSLAIFGKRLLIGAPFKEERAGAAYWALL